MRMSSVPPLGLRRTARAHTVTGDPPAREELTRQRWPAQPLASRGSQSHFFQKRCHHFHFCAERWLLEAGAERHPLADNGFVQFPSAGSAREVRALQHYVQQGG